MELTRENFRAMIYYAFRRGLSRQAYPEYQQRSEKTRESQITTIGPTDNFNDIPS
ncbi:unnamed protein product [Acanthoscelides obtectus]|uniref:Uncharacterized protein n=1 Tax=Acanthoscelides obtectus TaxID=200917 RepID=A0A9P0LKW5_ACAOB|nr:unnamed protein product [Acanthoscelides obtectus]CAK1655741.1 hypothetical protein AOBTE_LOCUS19292 [Acanthoscelides obtectus]